MVFLKACLKGIAKIIKQILRHIIQQGKFVDIVIVEGRAVKLGRFNDILDRYIGETFRLQ
ncbi:hypothetical protein SDC9_92163 [bioreactor metagenome]|uniref:Uncharacterized protein n=1 Tax=bioreactor metagenome TaxID=1076179 RepID=A0A644ZXM9_9ZZZZ